MVRRRMKLLVIEDDREAAAYISKGLSESGYVVDHAPEGRTGLFMASSGSYDALIVDRMLPGMDGLALVAALRNAMNRVAGDLTERLMGIIGGTITGVVYGIVGTGLAQALAALIGFWIAGVPGAFMLASLTFILSIVPAGPPLIWIGATGWLVYHDQPGCAVFMAVWGFFVVSWIDNIVKPLLISRGASLPFVLVLLGVLGGVLAFGFVGIFLGPTLLAVGFNLTRHWIERRAAEPPASAAG